MDIEKSILSGVIKIIFGNIYNYILTKKNQLRQIGFFD